MARRNGNDKENLPPNDSSSGEPPNDDGFLLPPLGSGESPISIEEEMKRSYLDYAMSVIVSRALPDVRDGLKPVQRRILYAMSESGYLWNRPHRKSARVVGDVMGKYHPHGDQSIYDALVRMTQSFSLRVELLDGHGNFGSLDGDMPAAMRYTEVRLAPIAQNLLDDIDKNTVNFRANYDESESEPEVLPSVLPNLFINGAGGIAVGMATNIPPHNPLEIVDACLAFIDNDQITDGELTKIVKGPDFPTGGIILGTQGIKDAYKTGRGSIKLRAKVAIEKLARDREALIVSEVPYQVNKSQMIQRIADLVRTNKIEGISGLRDESDRQGVRVVIEIRKDSQADIVLNQLWSNTSLQISFSSNMLALVGGRPQMLTLKRYISEFVRFREEVVVKRTRYELSRARDRAHILAGLSIAVANIDKIIALIKKAKDSPTARAQLMKEKWKAKDVKDILTIINDQRYKIARDGSYKLSPVQARAILDLRLHRLTALGREDIAKEMKELAEKIKTFLGILGEQKKLYAVLRGELEEIRSKVKSPRRTEILKQEAENIDEDDLVQSEEAVVTVSHKGFIKRAPLADWRAQKRGGKGKAAMLVKDTDFAARIFITNTKDRILFFSSLGKVYQMKAWRLPQGAVRTRGKAMTSLLQMSKSEFITSVMPVSAEQEQREDLFVMFATRKGYVRRNKLSDFININRNGKIAMKLEQDDDIVSVALCSVADDVLLTTQAGMCVRFSLEEVRVFSSRTSAGVRGISLEPRDSVISMSIMHHVDASPEERNAYIRRSRTDDDGGDEASEVKRVKLSDKRFEELQAKEEFVLTISIKGYGKRSSSYAFRTTKRGGKGIVAMKTGSRNGVLVGAFPVDNEDEIMVITDDGQAIRCAVDGVRLAGRTTQGVKVLNTKGNVVSTTRIEEDDSHSSQNIGSIGSE